MPLPPAPNNRNKQLYVVCEISFIKCLLDATTTNCSVFIRLARFCYIHRKKSGRRFMRFVLLYRVRIKKECVSHNCVKFSYKFCYSFSTVNWIRVIASSSWPALRLIQLFFIKYHNFSIFRKKRRLSIYWCQWLYVWNRGECQLAIGSVHVIIDFNRLQQFIPVVNIK